jgi:hypothetical protein
MLLIWTLILHIFPFGWISISFNQAESTKHLTLQWQKRLQTKN